MRGWPSNRFLFVLFWTFVALASAVPILAIPGFDLASQAFHREMGTDDWRLWYFAFSAIIVDANTISGSFMSIDRGPCPLTLTRVPPG